MSAFFSFSSAMKLQAPQASGIKLQAFTNVGKFPANKDKNKIKKVLQLKKNQKMDLMSETCQEFVHKMMQ